MSRHVPRHERWKSEGPTRFRSVEGLVVFRQKGQWWAEIAYRLLSADTPTGDVPVWQTQQDRLGPFKRPRNAMVEAERHATLLRNRYEQRVQFAEADFHGGG